MKLALRDCQVPMVDAMTSMARCNVFASPGTGKTSSTLMALDVLSIIEDNVFPVLVVAPKRVANNVWSSEADLWARFKGMRISRILGDVRQREAAVKAHADIYVINYENLAWLHGVLEDRWPFKTVVADESTRIKSHRCHFRTSKKGGEALYIPSHSKHASSLVRYAPRIERWYNLSGTPTPNGVKDLWGQQWPIDFGAALGRTFSSFADRWFRMPFGATREQGRLELLPHAEIEITERLHSTSVLVDAYDYFDIERPVEIDIKIELPPRVRKIYNDLHRDSVVDLEEYSIVSVNTGSKVMKCRQIASGHVMDDDGTWQTLHGEKLVALSDLRESLLGAPLLVAYWFKEDLKAIQKRFKDAVVLPSDHRQKQVEDDWNAGKIPMLLIHPQSAGHGLSLQHGGHHLCIYTMDWNAEYYEQVIERLGPTRQAQSGYKRLVYIHRIIASRTWEEIVAERIKEKFNTSETVKRALALRL